MAWMYTWPDTRFRSLSTITDGRHTMEKVTIPDFVVEKIISTVGSRPPESGGALLGLRHTKIITGFLFDINARTGNAVFHNSSELIEAINDAETTTPQQFMGILHSHPRGMSVPSGQDQFEIEVALKANPSMPVYYSPILTFGGDAPLQSHELAVGDAKISVYGSHRMIDCVELRPTHPVVAPFAASIRAISDRFTPPKVIAIDGTHAFLTHIEAYEQRYRLTIPLDYPTSPPIIVNEAGHQVPVLWRTDVPAHDRLAFALSQFHKAMRTPTPGSKPTATPTHDPSTPAPTTPTELTSSDVTWKDLHARAGGMLSRRIHDRSVVVIGAGSVGSDLAEALVRSGVGTLTLIDPDTVESHNLGRSRYDESDIGKPKAEALAARLRRISGSLSVRPMPVATDTLQRRDLFEIIREADVVVAATDDSTAQGLVNQLSRFAGTPAVFAGLYARAAGGEIIVSREGLPCWECATGGARTMMEPEVARQTDYGTGRLVAEPGLVTDIQFVTSATAKLVLGLLDHSTDARDNDCAVDDSASAFVEQALAGGTNYIVFGMRPGYWIFPAAMGDAAGQYALQSIWMKTEASPACAVCGEDRENPLNFGTPDADDIRNRLGNLR